MLLLLAALTFSTLRVEPRKLPDAAGVVVINTEADWAGFAIEVPPRVDFRRHTVVAVFAGEKPTGGWSVRITDVQKRGSACFVRHRVDGPPRDAVVTQAITHPYAVARVNAKCETVTLR